MANQHGAPMSGILIVGPSWIGDMVMAQSLYIALRQRNPEVRIDVLAPAWSAPVLRRMPEVHRAVSMPIGHGTLGLMQRYRLGRSLRAEHYAQAIVLPRSFKSALTPFFAGIKRRTGFRGETRYGLINDMRALDKEAMPLMVQRYLALGSESGAVPVAFADMPRPHLCIDADNQRRLLAELALDVSRPVIGFMPGAEYGPAKRWPPEHFAALARALIERGRRVWLFGSEKDAAICAEIARLAGADFAADIIDLSGRTRLEDAIDLIALTEWAVTNDSGLMHVAAATGRRILALYGSSTPSYTPPLSDRAEVMYLGLECSPCFERQCPLGHYHCLRQLEVESVLWRMGVFG
ncbi:MAG: lipopolysaccharide heptosyltransferase II [Chromatiales bacterium]|nr:lipopolysaccharide heptosyltransferase II [Chromatiales bacterium]